MPLKKCCAKDCAVSAHLYPDLALYKFPRDLDRCRTWVRNAGNDKLLQAPSRKLSVRRYLCATHFEEDQFFDKFRRRLRRTAVPTIFSCAPLSEELMLKFPVNDNEKLNGISSPVDSFSGRTPNSLCSQYKTFPFPSVKSSVKSQAVPFELDKDEESESITSPLKIPYSVTARDLKSIVPGPGSITYIEGPWCKTLKGGKSMNKFQRELHQCESGNEMEEVILHHVIENLNHELPTQDLLLENPKPGRPDTNEYYSTFETTSDIIELPSKLPLYPFLIKNNLCTKDGNFDDSSDLSDDQSPSELDNIMLLPPQEKHFMLLNRQLSNGAEVRVMHNMPQATKPCVLEL